MSVVLITGASSGIGLAAARIMSAAGDQVVGIASAPMEEGEIAESSGDAGTAPEAGDASGQAEAGQAEAGQP